MVVTNRHLTDTRLYLNRLLDEVGDGTGNINANVNASVTPRVFKISAPTLKGNIVVVDQLLATIEGAGPFRVNTYGAGAALANGIQFALVQDSTNTVLQDLTEQHRIHTNVDWSIFAHPVDLKSWGGGNSHLSVQWTIPPEGTALLLDGGSDLAIAILLYDDFSALTKHHFSVQGFRTVIRNRSAPA